MKTSVFCAVALFLSIRPAFAALQLPSDAAQLGMMAGAAQACKAYKDVYIYEEIASRLIASMSAGESAERIMMQEYVKSKLESFQAQRTQNRLPCGQLVNRFVKMPIFKFELYSDGTLKTPEGKFLYPRGQKSLKRGAVRTYPPLPRNQAPARPVYPYPVPSVPLPQGYPQQPAFGATGGFAGQGYYYPQPQPADFVAAQPATGQSPAPQPAQPPAGQQLPAQNFGF